MGAKLTVREGQVAVFVNEGQIADLFQPGLYSLSTQNMPVMTTLRSWKYGFESPFKAEVYFISTRNFLDMKWGTKNPVMMRDSDFGVVRLRAFGTYGIRVTEPQVFLKEVVGTDGQFTTGEIEGQLRSMIVSAFTDMLGKSQIAALDLAANYRDMGEAARNFMEPEFQEYGISLTRFLIENISVPPEVEKMMDTRSQMGVVGDMGKFTQFQTASAITDAAKAGGGAGDFMGMGAGIAMGQQMAGAMASSLAGQGQQQSGDTGATGQPGGAFCTECGAKVAPDAKFCSGCGKKMQAVCPNCAKAVKPDANFCSECGSKVSGE
jgi:membrane protease subunit (stomatin/prohibitin family)